MPDLQVSDGLKSSSPPTGQTTAMNAILFHIKKLNWQRNYAMKYLRFWFAYTLNNFLSAPRKRPAPKAAEIKKILLIRNDLIGDMVATSGLIRNLAQAGYEVYVSSRKTALEIIRYNPYVAGTFEFDDQDARSFRRCLDNIGKQKFDLAFECRSNTWLSRHTAVFYRHVNSNILIGVNKKGVRAFNANIDHQISNLHVTQKLALLLDYLGVPNRDMSYDLFTNQEIDDFIAPQLPQTPYAVVNPFGSQLFRHFSHEQIAAIAARLHEAGYPVVLIGEPALIGGLDIPHAQVIRTRQLLDIVPIIRNAALVVTVDTSVTHIATAFAKHTLVFYRHDKEPQADTARLDLVARTKQQLMEQHNLAKLQLELGEKLPREELEKKTCVNSVYWGANNKNAKKILLDYGELRQLPIEELNRHMAAWLQELNNKPL